jgi:hypothetical protein
MLFQEYYVRTAKAVDRSLPVFWPEALSVEPF